MWDLPGPGTEPVSPASAGGFLTTGPPGKSNSHFLEVNQLISKIFSNSKYYDRLMTHGIKWLMERNLPCVLCWYDV